MHNLEIAEFSDPVVSLALSPDGGLLLADDSGDVSLWNLRNGTRQEIGPGGFTESRYSVAFSSDGRHFFFSRRVDGVSMRSTATSEEVRRIPPERLEFFPEACFALSPDDKLLLFSYAEILYLCGVGTGAILAALPEEERVRSIAWSPDGRLVAAGHVNGRITVWDLGSFAAAGAKKQR